MQPNRTREQHIAVFGESGSGKTVMISSFYGATQEPEYRNNNLFDIVADDFGQGSRLHRNYLGMKNSAQVPDVTRFSATSYSFSVNLKDRSAKAMKARPFDALRLVWHDYPGEWFEEDVSGPEEAQRRVDTFRSLLGSDVALMLVDGQRLLDNAGEEERYLKSLMTNFRNGLQALTRELLVDGKPLVKFPRIWMFALSKSDLVPDLTVSEFRDLLVEKSAGEIEELQNVLASLVDDRDRLSVGEDFVLLSSARFGSTKIEVTKRVGLQLILPLGAMLPFERHVRWAQVRENGGKVAEFLLGGGLAMATALGGAGALAAVLAKRENKLLGAVAFLLVHLGSSLNDVARLGDDKLKKANADALSKHHDLRAVLTGFQLELRKGEDDQILLTSRR